MEQHPVPQHLASYEFRLVGDMTLKQFAQLAAGGILAIIMYALPIPAIFKWPLVVWFAFLGFAFAFLPINERPLSVWVISFFKAAFSPTIFIWQKKAGQPEMFKHSLAKPIDQKTPNQQVDKTNLNNYLSTLPYAENKDQIDQQEESFLKEVDNLFQLTPSQPSVPTPQPQLQAQPQFEPEPIKEVPSSFIPPTEPVKPKYKPFVPPSMEKKPKRPTVEAKINQELPMPMAASQPNIATGMVLDNEGKILEGAILEIRDPQGNPVRALKSNKLGQFMIATSLENGQYEIEVDKEGYQFDIIKIETKGEIFQPIEIRAKGTLATNQPVKE